VVGHEQRGRAVEGAGGEGQAGGVGADGRAGSAGDVAGPVGDDGADAVAGQEPGQGPGAAADIDDGAAACGGQAGGDEGMDVTSRGEPLSGCLSGGKAAGIGVVVAGQRFAWARFRRCCRLMASVCPGDRRQLHRVNTSHIAIFTAAGLAAGSGRFGAVLRLAQGSAGGHP
jgi:hypothetical protein